MSNYIEIIDFIKNQFKNKDFIPLHEPNFSSREKEYVLDTIESTYVSSVGAYVDRFEIMMAELSKTQKAVAVVNGTSALQVALRLSGVCSGDEVLTQALTFIATANAIIYNGASPVFLDVDLDTMGLSPSAVNSFLEEFGELRNGICYNKRTNKKIAACMPMHTFGFPVHLEELITICTKWNIPIVEDAAESIGSEYKGMPTGSFGKIGVFSFNGNKIVTSGGGGAIVTNDLELGAKAKHLTTTAKVPHPYEYVHDEIGYNYRMPNLNAALACAQMEMLEKYIENKRDLAQSYIHFFNNNYDTIFKQEPLNTRSNYWLNTVLFANSIQRDEFLNYASCNNINARPAWKLMTNLNMYKNCSKMEIANSLNIEERAVNLPSSVRL
mgnify:CR=1 FL=1